MTARSGAPRVGIFDSGVGGLTVAAAVRARLPAVPLRYIADTAWFPYGGRPETEVEARAESLTRRLVDGGCDLVVVACNTASSAALERLRERFAVPIVGMEPPLKPAAERTRSGRVVVLATEGTARGARLERLNRLHANGAHVDTVPMPGLAALVEAGEVDGPRIEAMLAAALAAPVAAGADAIALGCTHYGFLRGVVERCAPGVEVLDAAEAVARRVEHQLRERAFAIPDGEALAIECAATGDLEAFGAVVELLRAAGADLPTLAFEARGSTATRSETMAHVATSADGGGQG